jgi:hypothetical protein
MAGLNFQTQTIINDNLDPDSGNAGKEVVLFEVKKLYGEESDKANNPDVVRIKRDFVFAADEPGVGKVMAIRKAEGYEAEPCIATIDFDAIVEAVGNEEKKYCRLDIYLGVEGAEPFIYATPWVQKGMPFWVEFTIKKGAEGKDVAAEVAKVLAKNHIFLVDKDLLHVSVKGAVMTLTGATEYQRFRNVEVRTFAVTDDYAELVAELGEEGKIELANRGKNAFGTYSQIVKDLRLPTAANYQWTHIRQVETPIVGAIYNQYIVEYCAPSTNEGLGAVGAKLESHTTHVFWVKRDSAEEEGQLCKDFEGMFETIGLSIEGKKASASEEPEEDSELNA